MPAFSIATVNTLFCKVFKEPDNLKQVLTADVIVFQEIINLDSGLVKGVLGKAGYDIVATAENCGLIIALRRKSRLSVIADSSRTYVFEKLSWFERLLVWLLVSEPHVFNRRGMLTANFTLPSKEELTVVNVHPGISFASKRIRYRQINKLNAELQRTYPSGNLIVAGDMNYRPGPEKADMQMQRDNGLVAVDLRGQPTWIARGWDFEWVIKIATFFNRKTLESYDAQMDTVLYRGNLRPDGSARTIETGSDHQAIVARFSV